MSSSITANQPPAAHHPAPLFRPVVSLAGGQIVGFEAVVEGYAGAAELEAILAAGRALPAGAWLSVCLGPELIRAPRRLAGLLVSSAGRSLVLEPAKLPSARALVRLRRTLVRADVTGRTCVNYRGEGNDWLRQVHELRPQVVKLDGSLVAGIGSDPVRQASAAGLRHFTASIAASMIAQGISSQAERATLVRLGVEHGQGPLLGKARPAVQAARRARRANSRRSSAGVTALAAPPLLRPDLIQRVNAILWEADGTSETMNFVSAGATELTGHRAERWVNEPGFWDAHLHPEDREATLTTVKAAIVEGRSASLEYRFQLADGTYRWFNDLVEVMPLPDGHSRLVGVMIDVTERRQLEEKLAHRALHDPLTELLNREGFSEALADSLLGPRRTEIAVLFLDLDEFKIVNDSLGHAAGDELLRVIAGRLRASVRAGDAVARFGGDEFVIMAGAAGQGELAELAERLVGVVGAPSGIGGRNMPHPVSIGVAFAGPADSPASMLRNADMAMYAAKQRGGGCVEVYRPEMLEAALHRLEDRSAPA